MKTAISIPDAVFDRAERLAHRLGKSRSEMYRDALAEFVARHDVDEVTEAMDRVCVALDAEADAFVGEARRRLLEAVEW